MQVCVLVLGFFYEALYIVCVCVCVCVFFQIKALKLLRFPSVTNIWNKFSYCLILGSVFHIATNALQ